MYTWNKLIDQIHNTNKLLSNINKQKITNRQNLIKAMNFRGIGCIIARLNEVSILATQFWDYRHHILYKLEMSKNSIAFT